MNILPTLLVQRCVYWPPGQTDRHGVRAPGQRRPLACAFESTRRTIKRPNGASLEISSTVFLAEPVEEEGWIWLGPIEEAPTQPDDQLRIKAVSRHSDTDDREQLWKAMV